ncbi:MAG: cyclic nucleotide-binding domain-containing protein [Nitrospina sp.]|nr:cyclic nucleotide-binding domain-containing protein [Nitrospina sp.]
MADKLTQQEVSFLMQALKEVEMFTFLTVSEMDTLISQMHKVNIPKGKVIFSEGDDGTAMFILFKGKIQIALKKWFGRKHVISIIKAGEIFGEMSLATFRPRMATAVALEKSECFVLFKSSFQFAVNKNPAFIVHLKELIERRGIENRKI